jgi:DNA-binding response OmpR family regulator
MINKDLRKAVQVLIVEDDPLAAGVVELALSMIDENIQSTFIRSSNEAVDMLNKRSADFQLIVLDLDLESQGAGLAVLYKAMKIPTVVVTGRGTKDVDESLVMKVGAANFFAKPLDPEKFSRTVHNLLRLTGAFKQIYVFPGGCTYNADTGTIYVENNLLTSLGDMAKLFFDLLVLHYPLEVPTEEFMQYLYNDPREDRSLLYNVVSRLRDSLRNKEIPLDIESIARGRGGGGYRLVSKDSLEN